MPEREELSMKCRELLADEIDRLVTSMDNDGYGVLREYFSKQEIDEAARFVVAESAKHRGEYFFYNGSAAVAGTLMAELGESPVFRRMLAEVYERAVGKSAPPGELYQALRVLSGRSGLKLAWKFHYDTYVITALVPIIIPSEPGVSRGDLVIYPRLRGIRRNAIVNLVDRILFQNRLVQHFMARTLIRRLLKARVIRMETRNAYFFRGYESLHANEPCSPNVLRCTALFHFADPHEGSTIVRIIRDRRQDRRMRVSAQLLKPGGTSRSDVTQGRREKRRITPVL
jgi:hypothetical protein